MIEKIIDAKETMKSSTNEIPSFLKNLNEMNEIKDQKTNEIPSFFNEKNDNVRCMITRNESLEGDVHPITGVSFESKTIELPNGQKVEGVFPEFITDYEAAIPQDLYEETDRTQFKVCNEQLYDEIQKNSELKGKFTEEQIEQIKDGISDGSAPDGYVWHHSETPGKIQLVDFDTHSKTGHTGGRSVWGGGSENR